MVCRTYRAAHTCITAGSTCQSDWSVLYGQLSSCGFCHEMSRWFSESDSGNMRDKQDDGWSGGTTASPAERSLNSMEICHAKSRSLLSCLLHEHTIPEPLNTMGYVLRSPVIFFRAFWCNFGFTDTVFKRNPWFSLSVTVCSSSTTHHSLANLGCTY